MKKLAINADSGTTATRPTQPTAVSVICKERNMLCLHGGRASWRMKEGHCKQNEEEGRLGPADKEAGG